MCKHQEDPDHGNPSPQPGEFEQAPSALVSAALAFAPEAPAIIDSARPREVLCLLATERETMLAAMLSSLNQGIRMQARGECVDELIAPLDQEDAHLLIDWKLVTGAARTRAFWSTQTMILFDEWPDMDTLSDLVLDGAGGCLLMSSPAHLYHKAIEALCRGELWFRREALTHAIEKLLARGERLIALNQQKTERSDESSTTTPLSAREQAIVALVRDGRSNKEIGNRLGISNETVKKHLARIFRRLGIRNRTQLVLVLNIDNRFRPAGSR